MKKLLHILIFAAAMSQAVNAQDTFKPKRFYIDASIGGLFMPEHEAFGGGLGVGYFVAENHLLAFEFNGGQLSSEKIDTYNYWIKYSDNSTKTFTDGEISRDCSLNTSLLMYHYVLGDFSSKFRFRFGAGAGVYTISARDSYSPEYKDGAKIEGIPSDRRKKSKTSPAAAASTGMRWHFSRAFFADFGYRFIFGAAAVIDEKEYSGTMHQFRIGVGWQF
ncbi:MAG: outer membrane beta-barrel protein [Prevotellaceae bacterium]|jgi:opacity protein-like surface antigen|nr:outer membrane beta-barrel protein [Prevotellaceae bacterium]